MPEAVTGDAAKEARRFAVQVLYDLGIVGHNFWPDEKLFFTAFRLYQNHKAFVERNEGMN